jgi:transposase
VNIGQRHRRRRNKTSVDVRLGLADSIVQRGLSIAEAATAAGVSEHTAKKWLARFLLGGRAALSDGFRLAPKRRAGLSSERAIAIVDLNRQGLRASQIAELLGISLSQVRQVLARLGGDFGRGRVAEVGAETGTGASEIA